MNITNSGFVFFKIQVKKSQRNMNSLDLYRKTNKHLVRFGKQNILLFI